MSNLGANNNYYWLLYNLVILLYTLLLGTCPIRGLKLARLFVINMWLFWSTYLTIFNHNNVLTSSIETGCVYYPYCKWKKNEADTTSKIGPLA